MKIITVAAGAGSRLANLSQLNFGINIPKPLYPVLGKPMVYWSYKSFANWITLGIVKPSDFIFVVRKEHEELFSITDKIREVTHPKVQFQLLDKLTSGPAETALLAIQKMEASQKSNKLNSLISKSEAVIVNDCDHFFNANSMLYELYSNKSKDNFDILLAYTKPRRSIASWSFIETGLKKTSRVYEVKQIVEKDPSLLDSDKGIVGAYYFANTNLFKDLYKNTLKFSGEKYISTLIASGIKNELKVFAAQAKFGFPLGTEADIVDFEHTMSGQSVHKFKADTYFVDIDGVLLHHDPGFHSLEENYNNTQILISSNIEQLKTQYSKGDCIVLTTSRPESEREKISKIFSDFGFEFDHLIMGLGDGVRFLVNDRKTTDSYIDTAVAVNVLRNQPYNLINHPSKFMAIDIKSDLTSGSGAYTLKLSDPTKNSVIKKIVAFPSQNPEPSFVLNVQKKWYESIYRILPNNTPKVLNFNRSEDFVSLELEDITPSISLNRLISNVGQEGMVQSKEAVNNLVSCLNHLYSQTGRPQKVERSAELEYFIINKSMPGIEALYKSANYTEMKLHKLKRIKINGINYDNPLSTLQLVLKHIQNRSLSEYGFFSGIEAEIHGDLTGENILVKPNNTVYLIDPLSTYLCPQKRIDNELSMSHGAVSYDFIKIIQSFYAGYENWATSTTAAYQEKNGTIFFDESLAINSISTHLGEVLDMYADFGVNTSEKNMNMLGALMLFRLIPYRLLINEVSALYCLSLGTLMLERIL
jgi:NDP-sugar pyrophosphorylase family protein